MPQITIIGLGTVGQSLGLALHRYMQTTEGQANHFTIIGYDPDPEAGRAARSRPAPLTARWPISSRRYAMRRL